MIMIRHGCMIDEHIISFESNLNKFITICGFNTKTCYIERETLMI
jgi:hypothetical protein